MMRRWAALATALVVAATAAVAGVNADNSATRYLVDNLNRDVLGGLRVGDLVKITFVAGAETLTGWNMPDSGVTVKEVVDNRTIVLIFEDPGIYPIAALAADAAGDPVEQDTLFLTIGTDAISCHVWRTCFTHGTSGTDDEPECLTSWSALSLSSDANISLRVWLGFASDAMRTPGEAFSMTEAETVLTEEMYLLGEQPRARIIQGRFRTLTEPLIALRDIDPKADAAGSALGVFDEDAKFWTFTLTSQFFNESHVDFAGDTIGIHLDGQAVSAMGCSAEARHLWLDLPKYELESDAGGIRDDLVAAPILAEDYCAPTYIFQSSANPGSVWVAQGFMASAGGEASSVVLVQADQEYPTVSILDIAPTRHGLVFLHAQGLSRLHAALDSDAITFSAGVRLNADISALALTHLAAPMACDWILDHGEQTRNDVLVAWNDDDQDASVYLLNFPTNHSAVGIRQIPLDTSYRVLQVLPLVSAARSIALVHDGTDYAVLGIDEISEEVSRFPALPIGIDASARIASPVAPDGQLLLWTDTTFYVSPSGGASWRKISFATYDLVQADFVVDPDPFTAAGDAIEQVTTSMLGTFAVRTNHGRLFTGTFGLAKAIETQSPFHDAGTTSTTLHYRPDGTLLGIEGQAQASVRVFRIEPLYRVKTGTADLATVDASLFEFSRLLQCPYLEWAQLSPDADSFYADMNDEIEVSTLLTHDVRIEGLHVSFQTSDRTLIDMRPGEETMSASANGLLIRRARKVQLAVPPDTSARTGVGHQDRASGKVVVRATPTRLAPACETPTKMLQIHVGCPRGRHLRYNPPAAYSEPSTSVVSSACKDEAESGTTDEEVAAIRKACTCRQYENRRITLPKDIVDEGRLEHQAALANRDLNWTDDEVSFAFDMDTYGCPTFVPYTYTFVPGLEIWDGDVKVKDVDADFVVLEMNARNDYSYGLTASLAGCLRRPETWDAKLASEANITSAWGSHNHQTCFAADPDAINGTIQEWGGLSYEILNATSSNYITFKSTTLKDTPFEFVAIVVDPDYSFCTLQTYFSVEPYGIPIDGFTTFIIIFTVVMCSMLMLLCTYLVHRHDILNAAQRNVKTGETKKTL